MSFSYHRPSAYLPPQPGSYAPGPAGPSWGYGGGPPHPPPPAAPPMPPAAPVAPAGSASSGMRKPAGSGGGVRHVEAEWVLTLEQVYRLSPSQRDGLDDATERRFRREGCRLAEEMALKLDMGRVAATTALIFFHRFYTRNSFKHHDRYAMAGAAVLLAGKVEERARKLKDVALSFLTLQQGSTAVDPTSEGFAERLAATRRKLAEAERRLLNGLGFDLNVVQPYTAFRDLRDRVVAADPSLCTSLEAKRIKQELAALYKKQREKKQQQQQSQSQSQSRSQPPSRVPSSTSLIGAAAAAAEAAGAGADEQEEGEWEEGEERPTTQQSDLCTDGDGGPKDDDDDDEEMDDDVFQLALAFMHDSLHTVACLLSRIPTLAALGIFLALKLHDATVPGPWPSWRHLLGIQDEPALYVMAREVLSLYASPPPSPNEEGDTKMPPPRPIPEKQRIALMALNAAVGAEEEAVEAQRHQAFAPLPTGPPPLMRIDPYPQPPPYDYLAGHGYQVPRPYPQQPGYAPHPPLRPPSGSYYPPSPPRRDTRPQPPPSNCGGRQHWR